MARDDSWMQAAVCNEIEDLRIFFPRNKEERQAFDPIAKALCRNCPVRVPCKTYAIAHRIKEGTWGGMTQSERASVPRSDRDLVRRLYFRRHPVSHPMARHAGPYLPPMMKGGES